MAKYKSKTKDCRLMIKVRLSSGEKIDRRELENFSRTGLRGLLKVRMLKKFGVISLHYTGPIGISLFERLKKPVSKYDFLFTMEQIVDMVQKLEKNSMSTHKIVWDIHQVYINENTREVQFIYMPLETLPDSTDILGFINHIIYSMTPIEEQNSDYISRFAYLLKGLNGFDAEKIEQFILKEDRSIVHTIKKRYGGQSGFMTDKPKDYYEHYDEMTDILADEETGLLGGEDTGLLDEGNTSLLEEDRGGHYPSLYRVLTEENICINKPVFRIGKEQSYADYFVANNSAVSRSHADVITRGKSCFVIDLNSKNKTFINGQPIPVHQETEIFDGDKLYLANEEFIFHF